MPKDNSQLSSQLMKLKGFPSVDILVYQATNSSSVSSIISLLSQSYSVIAIDIENNSKEIFKTAVRLSPLPTLIHEISSDNELLNTRVILPNDACALAYKLSNAPVHFVGNSRETKTILRRLSRGHPGKSILFVCEKDTWKRLQASNTKNQQELLPVKQRAHTLSLYTGSFSSFFEKGFLDEFPIMTILNQKHLGQKEVIEHELKKQLDMKLLNDCNINNQTSRKILVDLLRENLIISPVKYFTWICETIGDTFALIISSLLLNRTNQDRPLQLVSHFQFSNNQYQHWMTTDKNYYVIKNHNLSEYESTIRKSITNDSTDILTRKEKQEFLASNYKPHVIWSRDQDFHNYSVICSILYQYASNALSNYQKYQPSKLLSTFISLEKTHSPTLSSNSTHGYSVMNQISTPVVLIFDSIASHETTTYDANLFHRKIDYDLITDEQLEKHENKDKDRVFYSVYAGIKEEATCLSSHVTKSQLNYIALLLPVTYMGYKRYKTQLCLPSYKPTSTDPRDLACVRKSTGAKRAVRWAVECRSNCSIIILAKNSWKPDRELVAAAKSRNVKLLHISLEHIANFYPNATRRARYRHSLSTALKMHSRREKILKRILDE